jgi:hypothetical protein
MLSVKVHWTDLYRNGEKYMGLGQGLSSKSLRPAKYPGGDGIERSLDEDET